MYGDKFTKHLLLFSIIDDKKYVYHYCSEHAYEIEKIYGDILSNASVDITAMYNIHILDGDFMDIVTYDDIIKYDPYFLPAYKFETYQDMLSFIENSQNSDRKLTTL